MEKTYQIVYFISFVISFVMSSTDFGFCPNAILRNVSNKE